MSAQIVKTERPDGITVIQLTGSMGLEGADQLDLEMHAMIAAPHKPTIVDLAGVTEISSLGMGTLMACATSLRRKSVGMVLMNPQHLVLRALDIAGISRAIPIVMSEAEAIETLGKDTSTA